MGKIIANIEQWRNFSVSFSYRLPSLYAIFSFIYISCQARKNMTACMDLYWQLAWNCIVRRGPAGGLWVVLSCWSSLLHPSCSPCPSSLSSRPATSCTPSRSFKDRKKFLGIRIRIRMFLAVFGPPGSASGSVSHAKILRKTFISTVL